MVSVTLFAFLSCIVLSAALTWSVRNLAFKRGWVRTALSSRHIHPVSMPRLGGIAIAAVVTAIGSVSMFALWLLQSVSQSSVRQMVFVVLAALVSFTIGLMDDFLDITAWQKVLAEIAAGLLLWTGGVRVLVGPLFQNHHFGAAVSISLTVSWVLLISNAFNLIDGLDGLAAGSALFSVLTVFVVSVISHNLVQSLMAAILAGAVLGFLRYNFNPATIYLGDSGSLFIGTFLAGLTLTGVTQQKSSTLVAVGIPLVAFGFPVVETSVSIVRRFISGQPIFVADREHIHHKLLDRGWSHKQVVVALYGVSALCGLLSLALLSPGQPPLAIVLLVLGVGVVLGIQHLGYHEFFEIGRVARRVMEQRQVIVNNLAIRRGAEALARCDDWNEISAVLQNTFVDNDFDEFRMVIGAKGSDAVFWNYRWERPVPRLSQEMDSTNGWSLSVQLEKPKNQWTGKLELFRTDNSVLLLDVNLLTSELQMELGRACQRAFPVESHVPSAKPVHLAEKIGWESVV